MEIQLTGPNAGAYTLFPTGKYGVDWREIQPGDDQYAHWTQPIKMLEGCDKYEPYDSLAYRFQR